MCSLVRHLQSATACEASALSYLLAALSQFSNHCIRCVICIRMASSTYGMQQRERYCRGWVVTALTATLILRIELSGMPAKVSS